MPTVRGRAGSAGAAALTPSRRSARPRVTLARRRAGVAELVDATGLGPVGLHGPWRFKSSRPHLGRLGLSSSVSTGEAGGCAGGAGTASTRLRERSRGRRTHGQPARPEVGTASGAFILPW